jgi:hypothetical protein
MATQFVDKKAATTEIVDRPNAAGIGVVDGQAYVHDGSAVRALLQAAAAGQLKIVAGQHTTVDADDTVVTGLSTVVAVVATLDSDPVDGAMYVTATIGDQDGAPAAGSVQIKTWKNTDADATHIAATTFSLLVNWIAIGT